MSRIATSIARQIVAEAADAGITLPAGFLDALDAAAALRASSATAADVDVRDLSNRVLDHLANGRDPLADKQVQRMLQLRTLGTIGLAATGEQRAEQMCLDAVAEHGGTIIGLLADATVDACEVLHTAATGRLAGHRNIMAVTASSAADPVLLAHTVDAYRRLTQALGVQNAVVMGTTGGPAQRNQYTPLRWADCSRAQLTQAFSYASASGRQLPDVWDTARTGAKLGLVPVAEAMSRAATHMAEDQADRDRRRPSPQTVAGTFA